jgi:SAM-dependent methyltransferase
LNDNAIPICDYEGSDYQTRFWRNQGREYEDLCERIAIRRLLPPKGKRLLEIGTGFGRLVDLYQGYDQIVLLDYSKSLLRQAQKRLGRGTQYTYVAANLYHLPLADQMVDAVCMVRVIHHVVNVPEALRQIRRVLLPGGMFILEFACKLHLKSILRYALRRQSWSPYEPEPVEFVPLNFDFHPRWMGAQLKGHGFQIVRLRTVSHFRLPLLKRLVPARVLVTLDSAIQWTGQWGPYAPSVLVRARRKGIPASVLPDTIAFRCPTCGNSDWQTTKVEMHCLVCNSRWHIDDGIYDFKTAP